MKSVKMKALVLFSLIFPLQLISASESGEIFKSSEYQVSLIELYSSEGCHSCPPADRWLMKLKSDARLWKEFVPVAFHVDYWDYIGWKDTFANAKFTQRQRDYAALSKSGSMYTPEFFVNGVEWRGYFRKEQLPLPKNRKAGQLTVKIENNIASVDFQPLSNATSQPYHINIAILGFELSNEIRSGENKGKMLHHEFVALGHTLKTLKKDQHQYHIKTDLPNYDNTNNKLGLAAWITSGNNPTPIQATGGWLKAP